MMHTAVQGLKLHLEPVGAVCYQWSRAIHAFDGFSFWQQIGGWWLVLSYG